MKKSDLPLQIRQIGMLTTIPFLLVGGPLCGYWIGAWLDGRFGWDPYAKFILMVMGFFSAARETVRIIKEVSRASK